MKTRQMGKSQKVASARKSADYTINLDEIPNGTRKPLETCQFLEAMRNWRAESAQSKALIR